MASPPYSHNYGMSASPPYPSSSQLPGASKKRPSEISSGPAVKRRKQSMISNASGLSAHPLRQTSFPPDDPFYPVAVRSPSVDNMSLVSGSIAGEPGKKKRGRKPKNVEDTASVAGGLAPTAVSGVSGRGRASRGMTADEDDDVGGETAVAIVSGTKEEKQKESQHRAMLISCFDENQFMRFEKWRSSRLSEAVVRRLINQTLSQSAPASVILAVKSVTKIFAGEIIEGAVKVQLQWLEAAQESETGLQSPPPSENDEHLKERRRGPLTANHLQEALRRYKLERRSGCVGLLGLPRQQMSNGVERFGIRAMGKRLLN